MSAEGGYNLIVLLFLRWRDWLEDVLRIYYGLVAVIRNALANMTLWVHHRRANSGHWRPGFAIMIHQPSSGTRGKVTDQRN